MLFKSNGKILLTSEYLVLDGAKAIALPSKLTQELYVEQCDKEIIEWQGIDEKGNVWYEENFYLKNNDLVYSAEKNNTSYF